MVARPQAASGGRPHRVYQQGKRHMELVPSVSRSSGLEKDGDALKDPKVQAEYRTFIQEKVNTFWKTYPYSTLQKNDKHRKEEQENILILFRKLREGLLSSDRCDAFAIEVYETSLYLSVIFRSPKQTSSILSHLLPHLYLTLPLSTSEDTHPALPATLLSLLHYLLEGYPSQSRYHEHLYTLPRSFLPRQSGAYQWLSTLTRCLRSRNYARLGTLTDPAAFRKLLAECDPVRGDLQNSEARHSAQTGGPSGTPDNLALEALSTLVELLLHKARETAWIVLRSAYRELHCLSAPPDIDSTKSAATWSSTTDWLSRSLMLGAILPSERSQVTAAQLVGQWLQEKCAVGEVRPKEGTGSDGRWIVCKLAIK